MAFRTRWNTCVRTHTYAPDGPRVTLPRRLCYLPCASRPSTPPNRASKPQNEHTPQQDNAEALNGILSDSAPAPESPYGFSVDIDASDLSDEWESMSDEEGEEGLSDDEVLHRPRRFISDSEQEEASETEDHNTALATPVGVASVDSACFEEFEAILEEHAAAGPEAPPLTAERVCRIFAYPLDPFQRQAVERSIDGHSVVVCAPTGAGKTAIAVAAAVPILAAGKRVIYTTPLKALSNQKLFELQEIFGEERVGLRTGDVSINGGAPVMIMTTEILRNITYRVLLEEDEESHFSRDLDDVGLTVLDEVHYLGHRDRGSVWEEIVINCPSHVKLLAMSATVANPDEIGAWITHVHGPCETIQTHFRPVPLKWWFAWDEEDSELAGSRMEGLMDEGDGQPRLNSQFSAQRQEHIERLRGEADNITRKLEFSNKGGNRYRERAYQQLDAIGRKIRALERSEDTGAEPRFENVVATLRNADYLPAIYFVFSRKRCNDYALAMTSSLVEPHERTEILRALNILRSTQPDAIPSGHEKPLLNGAASHHAGLLPGWKSLVESLFQRGLIKVVFATETLAAGINMPARTTVISSISRRRDGCFVLLMHNEMLQMAGRAGRRGYDTQGHCVITQSRFDGPRAAVDIIARGPEQIKSQFSISYGMVLNLLSTRTLPDCQNFLDRSFLRFQSTMGSKAALAKADDLQQQALALMERASDFGEALEDERNSIKAPLEAQKMVISEARTVLRNVRKQALQARYKEVAQSLRLSSHSQGRVVSFRQALLGDADPLASPNPHEGRDMDSHASGNIAHPHSSSTASPSTTGVAQGSKVKSGDDAHPQQRNGRRKLSNNGSRNEIKKRSSAEVLTGGERLPALVSIDLGLEGGVDDEGSLRVALCVGYAIDHAPHVCSEQDVTSGRVPAGMLACLASDNKLYLVQPHAIAAIHDLPPENPFPDGLDIHGASQLVVQALHTATLDEWRRQGFVRVALGGVPTANLALVLAMLTVPLTSLILADSGWQEAVQDALHRVQQQRVKLRSLKKSLRKDGMKNRLKAGTSQQLANEADILMQRAKRIRMGVRKHDGSADWRDVLATLQVLQQFEALAEINEGGGDGAFELSDRGCIARDIRFENELFLALILQHEALEGVQPSTLAGLICALVAPFQISRPEIETKIEASDQLKELVDNLSETAVSLARTQASYGIQCPVQVDLRMAGLVEAWTWDIGWDTMKNSCSLEDGDTARLLCRVADLLKQIQRAETVDEQLRKTAQVAHNSLYRPPICDLLNV